MSQAAVDQNDPRRRYTHQAFDVTYFGKAQETGPTAINSRLSGTHQCSILLPSLDAGSTATVAVGDLTQGIYSFQLVNHVALTALTTLNLTLPAHGGLGQQVLIAAADLSATGIIDLTTPIAAPLTIDRPLTAAVAAGQAGETAIISLLVTPVENGWF